MLKFDNLGWKGTKVNSKAYAALANEVDHCDVEMVLDTKTIKGTCHLRHVGTGVVAEGHCGLALADALPLDVADCALTLTNAEIVRVIPEKASTLDLNDLFSGELAKTGTDGVVTATEAFAIADNVVTLTNPAPAGGVKVTVKFNLAKGAATTEENAAKVNLDAGDYQVHFIARVRDDIEGTRMPNPTMMEFVKHCRTLNVHA